MIGYIYMTTNLVTGKRYVGRKKSNVFLGNNYLGSGVHLKKSINLYGKENFSVELIEEVNGTYEDLVEREMFFIKLFNAVEDTMFYNQSYGGLNEGFIRGGQNIACTDYARKMNSEKHSGKKMSEEQKKYLSEYWKTHEHPKGYSGHHHSDKWVEMIKELSSKQVHTEERDKAVSEHHMGSKMMYKDNIQKWVYREDIEHHLNDGWKIGSCKKRKPKQFKNKN